MNEWKRVACLSDRLRDSMHDAGMKQTDLARATGIDKSVISRYLSGGYEPKPQPLSLMARALNVAEMWLAGYDVPKEREPEQRKNDALVQVVAQLRADPELFDMVLQLTMLPANQRSAVSTLLAGLVKK